MRAIEITKHGGPNVLEVFERSDPPLRPGEARIAVAACGINFADVMARIGVYPDAPKPPCVVGYEVAGTVVDLGEGVEDLERGQRVFAATKFKGYASQVCVPETDAVPLPDRFTFEQGAAIPVNYATAWAALVGYGSIQPREKVLIHSAGGGVGIAATQIARRFGADAIYGTASPSKHTRVRELGVDHVFDYSEVHTKAGLPGFDLILDPLGGKSLRTSYNLLRPGGRLIAYGASGVVSGAKRSLVSALRTVTRMPRFSLIKQMSESKAVIGLNMLSLWTDRSTLSPWIEPLRELLDDGTIAPVIAATFPFEQAGAAQDMLTQRRNIGKVVLVP
ncbi:MAG TPA: medium chain dehydrogenase/reductase family protein [Solirubrobacteraceae bacterium]|jgi:NADPH:quinone reductase-like Zn-dependent oxidoreductase